MIDAVLAAAPPPGSIDHLASCHGDEPGLGACGNPALRPVAEGSGKGLGQGVLGLRHVAHARREKRDQLAVALASDGLRCVARILAVISHRAPAYMAQIGRTSTTPWLAPGQRPAQDSAASRSGTSIM